MQSFALKRDTITAADDKINPARTEREPALSERSEPKGGPVKNRPSSRRIARDADNPRTGHPDPARGDRRVLPQVGHQATVVLRLDRARRLRSGTERRRCAGGVKAGHEGAGAVEMMTGVRDSVRPYVEPDLVVEYAEKV